MFEQVERSLKRAFGNAAGWLAVCVLATIAAGLLIAAAVVGFANILGTGGALGIVGGAFAVLALVVVLVLNRRRPEPPPVDNEIKIGEIAAGFLLGVWNGLSKPKPRDPD